MNFFPLLKKPSTKQFGAVFFGILVLTFFFLRFFPYGISEKIDFFRFDAYGSFFCLKDHVIADYNRSSLLHKIENPPAWMAHQIQKDLASQKPISSQDLDSFFFSIPEIDRQNVYQMVKVIIDSKGVHTFPEKLPYFDGRRRSIIEGLRILHKLGLLRPCEFLLSICDLVGPRYTGQVPLFAFSKNTALSVHRNIILIPDGMNMSKWGSIFPTIQFSSRSFPWDQKIDKIYWRGSSTNHIRGALVALGKTIPFIDALLTSGRNAAYAIPEEQIRYKYLISLDGVSSTWPGLLWKLASNSLTLKQESPHIQWYYGALKPHTHYLPVKNDLSDLEKVYTYAQAHDEEMRAIASNAQFFVENNVLYEDMLVYLKLVMDAYCQNIYSASTSTVARASFSR